jgi:endonuclease/exonuclease/phosphatase family metal-dependent hydrolase
MRLITWNVQWCRGIDGRVDPARIARTARELADFDLLCVQEVAVNFPGLPGSAGEDQMAALAACLPQYQPWFGAAVDVSDAAGGRRRFGNAIFTRLPAWQALRHLLPWPADPSLPSMPRLALELVLDSEFGPLRVATTHLEYYSQRQRSAQVEALRAMHEEACAHDRAPRPSGEAGTPFAALPRPATALLCGDFNFPPGSPEHARLTAPFAGEVPQFHDAWRLTHPDRPHPPTFRVHEAQPEELPYCCDFVFVTEPLAGRVQEVGVHEATRASDHQPVLVEIA